MFKNVMMMKMISNNICWPASPWSIIIAQAWSVIYYAPEIMTKVQEIKVNYSWTFRVVYSNFFYTWWHWNWYASTQIYKNWLPYWIVRNINMSSTWWTYTEDLYFSSWDLVQLYITWFDHWDTNWNVWIYDFSLWVAEECTWWAIVTLQ